MLVECFRFLILLAAVSNVETAHRSSLHFSFRLCGSPVNLELNGIYQAPRESFECLLASMPELDHPSSLFD
jgi:hypothetical protein